MTNTNRFSPIAACFSCAATFVLISVNDAIFAAQVASPAI